MLLHKVLRQGVAPLTQLHGQS